MFVCNKSAYICAVSREAVSKGGPHSYSHENENRHNSQFGLSISGRPANPSNFDESLYVPKKILSFHGAFFQNQTGD